MDIKQKFLQLTKRTYPHGTEKDLFPLLSDKLMEDEFGNLFINIGISDTMFTSHLDTATSSLTNVNHVIDGDIIKTDGTSILGADDKAGVVIMLYMIEKNTPGLYYFFLGEEVGCIGSRKVADKQKIKKIEGINKVVSFDRRGTTSVITHQSGKRCSSDKFAEALSLELNKLNGVFSYKPDDTGVLTDSIQFISIYPECTNISVGYQSEHTKSESQDIKHLEDLAIACSEIDWSLLPVDRDPSKLEYKSYGYGSYYSNDWDDYDYDYDYNQRDYTKWRNSVKSKPDKIWFHDKDFNYISCVEISNRDKKYISVDLHKERILREKYLIYNLLISIDVKIESIEWDGLNLKIYNKSGEYKLEDDIDRNDIIEYLPELDYRKFKELDIELDKDLSIFGF
jgi:hypothetical protein